MKYLSFLLLFIVCTINTSAQSSTQKNQPKPFVIGQILQLQSAILAETRTLNVYLPEGYRSSDTTRYPVVYLLDGGADEDFIHVVGLYQYNSFPWINRVAPSIIVGIVNTDRRRDMTFPTSDTAMTNRYQNLGHSDKFINFIQQELQPFIQQKFMTTSSRTLIGESLGGLFATEILLKHPTMFNTYFIISPSVWWNNGSILQQSSIMLTDTFSQKTNIYISVGKEGLTPGTVPRVGEVDVNLLADKLKSTKSKNVTVYFDYLPQETHPTIMHQSLYNALRTFSGNAE